MNHFAKVADAAIDATVRDDWAGAVTQLLNRTSSHDFPPDLQGALRSLEDDLAAYDPDEIARVVLWLWCAHGGPARLAASPASDELDMWVVYDHPRDFPRAWVARRWTVGTAAAPTGDMIACSTLEQLRAVVGGNRLQLPRHDADDPKVTEAWL